MSTLNTKKWNNRPQQSLIIFRSDDHTEAQKALRIMTHQGYDATCIAPAGKRSEWVVAIDRASTYWV